MKEIPISSHEFLRRSRSRKKLRETIVLVAKYFVMVLLALFLLFPYIFMVSKSLMNLVDANAPTPMLFPKSGV